MEFKPRQISLEDDFVGFPTIRKELQDIVNYLSYLNKLTSQGKDRYRRMLLEAECGTLFLGRTGAGKTHALHCIMNEALKIGYQPIDGSLMLEKTTVDPRDVRTFFNSCKILADEKPLLIVYDDARQLLGYSRGMMGYQYGYNPQEFRPMLGEFRRQIDDLQFFHHPAYIIVTSATSVRYIDRQIARRLSRHITFPQPQDRSRQELFKYYLKSYGYNSADFDTVTLSYLMDGVVAGRIEEIVSKASYKADMMGDLNNKLIVKEIIRFLQGSPTDVFLSEKMKIQTGFHEFGGHTLPAYAVGLEPILVTIEPSADGTFGKSFHRHSQNIPASSSKYYLADVITCMGSTAVHLEMDKSKEEGRTSDLTKATRSALNLYSLKNPLVNLTIGREGTYLSQGLFSEENKREIEEEIEKIKTKALVIAQDIIKKYRNKIELFIMEYLINDEIMVRSEILDTLIKLDVKPSEYYEIMCKTLLELGYPI